MAVNKFPYRILNDLSTKWKAAEDKIIQDKKLYKAKIADMLDEIESSRDVSKDALNNDVAKTRGISVVDHAAQTENVCVKAVANNAEVVAALQAQVDQLKQDVAELVFQNNRYHLAVSNCTFCASDVADTSHASISFDVSIRASTPVFNELPALSPSTIPALMSLATEDRKQNEADTVVKCKDKTFISRMVKTLTPSTKGRREYSRGKRRPAP